MGGSARIHRGEPPAARTGRARRVTPRPPRDIRPLARVDIAEAAGWYEDRVAGLGARFLARVGDALRSAHESAAPPHLVRCPCR